MRWGAVGAALLPVALAAGFLSGPVALGSLTGSTSGVSGSGTGQVASVASAASATATAATGATSATRQVPSVLSGLSLARYLAPAPADQMMTVGVSAERPDPAAVTQTYDEIYEPSSPLYRHYLTPTQFDQQFGLPSSEVSAIEKWLASDGLGVDTVSGDGSYYTASGTVADLDRLFDVRIGSYSFDGSTFLANDVAPSVPADLPVDDVLGLDTVQQFSLAPLTGAVSNLSSSVPASTGVGPQSGTQQALTAQDLWGVYDDPGAAALTTADSDAPSGTVSNPTTVASSTYDLGQGQAVGIFGEGETSSTISQLRLFEDALGLPEVPVRTVYTEGSPGTAYGDNTPDIEWYLDSQAITGMAPDISQFDFYFAKSLYDYDVFQAFSYWVDDPHGPKEMNASFGECEANPTDPVTNPLAEVPYGTEYGDQLEIAGDPMLEQATIEGRTLFTSAGDTGSGCPEVVVPVAGAGNGLVIQPIPEVSYPCTSVYAVCVSGTVVSVNGASYPQSAQRAAETSWTFGGGGSSFYVPEASFQQGVANIDMPCISTPQGDPYPPGSEPTCRGVPDVADMSGNVTGDEYFIYIDGEPSGEGGTSLSSPLMVGQWTRVQAGASKAVQWAGGLGFADPVFYDQASSADDCTTSSTASCTSTPYAQDFTNVSESEYGIGNGLYQPGPGWSYASGWGALNVTNFIADVDCSAQSDGCAATPAGARYTLGDWDHAQGTYSGAIRANDTYGGQETPADVVTTATLDGPEGWSTDPIDNSAILPGPDQAPGGPVVPIPGDNTTSNYDPSLDITGATLTATTDTVTATISGPYLGSLPPSTAGGGGGSFFVAWLYDGTIYFAEATQAALTGTWSFTSGNTNGSAYAPTSDSAATGNLSQNGEGSTLTIALPASEVGSPPAGADLLDPQAFDQLDAGTSVESVDNTADSADDLAPVSDLQSSDCDAPAGRTLAGYTDTSSWSTSEAGQQVLLCSLAESRGVAVEVQKGTASTSSKAGAGSGLGSATSPPLSVGAGPATITPLDPAGVSSTHGSAVPDLPLVSGLGGPSSPDRSRD